MSTVNSDHEKEAAARASLDFVRDGDIVGLGSGSTASLAIRFLAERVRAGLQIRGIPTSAATKALAENLGIPLATLDEFQQIDVAIDGADEIDPQLQLIKGGGGAMLREKVIASASRKFVVVADSTKQVGMLGRFPLPVEVIAFAQAVVARKITALGATVKIRRIPDGSLYVTDEGHHILDCAFGEIQDPPKLACALENIPGVAGHGLFVDMANVALIAKGDQVVELRRDARRNLEAFLV
jgi:ribose 5-phosphate isomerase A